LFGLRDVFNLRLPLCWQSRHLIFPPLRLDCSSFSFPTLCLRVLPIFALFFNLIPLLASPTLRRLHSVRRDTFSQRTKYLGSIILLTAWTDDLFRAVPSFPFFPYWSNHYFSHYSSTLLLLALGEYFSCHPNTALLTCISLLAGPFLSSCVGPLTAISLFSFFNNVNPMLWFKYCPKQAAHGLVPLFANPASDAIYASEVS
jgi:hypothetical protein